MSVAVRPAMLRWRMRFNLQEIDLRPGRIVLGRAAECPITIEDPLVSRHHAELLVTASGVVIRDLDSRNGVRVNGVRITAPTELHPNDRIRLGRDELVVLTTSEAGTLHRSTRPTGVQDVCPRCGHEHASGLVACARCGGTLSGVRLAVALPLKKKNAVA